MKGKDHTSFLTNPLSIFVENLLRYPLYLEVLVKKRIALFCLLLAAPLLAGPNVLIFAGSTREASYNKKLAQEAATIARKLGAEVTVIDLKDYPMPFYDGDLEMSRGMPENGKRLRQMIRASDAVLIASPEYNSSIPAVLKNTLDWVSRSEEKRTDVTIFKGKKLGIMSASPGPRGGARALVHLRAILENIGAEVVQKQVSVPKAMETFSKSGLPDTFKKELEEEIASTL